MNKYNVMVATEEEKAQEILDPKFHPKGTMHCQIEAVNEMVCRARHREGVFDGKYPKGSWIEPAE